MRANYRSGKDLCKDRAKKTNVGTKNIAKVDLSFERRRPAIPLFGTNYLIVIAGEN